MHFHVIRCVWQETVCYSAAVETGFGWQTLIIYRLDHSNSFSQYPSPFAS